MNDSARGQTAKRRNGAAAFLFLPRDLLGTRIDVLHPLFARSGHVVMLQRAGWSCSQRRRKTEVQPGCN